MKPTRYREIEVAGPPHEMGRQIGAAAGDEIRGFCELAVSRLSELGISRLEALAVAEESLGFARDYAPELVEELDGTAQAAGVSLADLMLLQVRNQFQPHDDSGCTSLAVVPGEERLVAQNWDNDPLLDEFTIVLTRRPENRPALMTVTQAGLIAYIGLSETGMGACLNTLPAPARRAGVPHYFTLRRLYETRTLEEAAAVVRSAPRAIPANIMLITPDGPADLEVTLDDVRVLTHGGSELVTHTNHCLHGDLLEYNEQFPELIQSHARKRRIDELLDERPDVMSIQAALRDHLGYPRSICRHANDDPQTGFWETVFSVIIEAASGTMWISRGQPCEQPYERYGLNAPD